jgi:hypothetical protein
VVLLVITGWVLHIVMSTRQNRNLPIKIDPEATLPEQPQV